MDKEISLTDLVPDLPEIVKNLLLNLEVGQELCDCRYRHHKVKEIHWEYSYAPGELELIVDAEVTFEDGFTCSVGHCCDPVDHSFKHEE